MINSRAFGNAMIKRQKKTQPPNNQRMPCDYSSVSPKWKLREKLFIINAYRELQRPHA